MGKSEEEREEEAAPEPESPDLLRENAGGRCPCCRSVGSIVGLRCFAALLLGVAVLLSAVFWLPPFFRSGSGKSGPDPAAEYGADIVASFRLQKPISIVHANVAKLQYDIFDEIGVPNTIVAVLYLGPIGLNATNVVFGMLPYPKNSNLSAGLSIIKSSFVSLVLGQSSLHLTMPLFGSSYFFQVMKFPGGITIIPPQKAFLLQKEKLLFNFTLNFPIYEVQGKIDELKDQMKLGLHLKSYEVLYVQLTNMNGSTVSPPTVVQASILLAVGNIQPSAPRLKQLAQNIRNSSAGNLGLNHTLFGRVKQISLSSFLQHSLNSGGSPSPAPAPQSSATSFHHHHLHHRHHNHHSDVHLGPAPAPSSNPKIPRESPPPRCPFGYSSRPKRKSRIAPAPAPSITHYTSVPPPIENVPAPAPHISAKSYLPTDNFTHARSPSEHVIEESKPPDMAPSISSSPFSCEFSLLNFCNLAEHQSIRICAESDQNQMGLRATGLSINAIMTTEKKSFVSFLFTPSSSNSGLLISLLGYVV
ncbi:hypothetical protein AXF42_Ash008605 [Apostasia shenzhenica]|uniref:DUF7036 domain-containing protein n=1 Tax=Apostasia shenzhenica TaxID=1088818 RepID=A0A2I0B1W8_9ASPA|nr:hypothetical protein AXF42_Ash008605 [Apostasia shenzhenica]